MQMKQKRVMRILSVTANALLLFEGSAVLLVLTLFRTSPAHGCPLGIGIFSLVTFLFLAVISVIEVVSALRIAGSTFYPAVIAVFLLAIVAFCPDTIAFYKLIGLPRTSETEDIAGEVCFVAVEIAVLAFFRNRYRAEVKILPFYPLFAAAAIDIVVYVSLLPFRMNIIAHFFFLIVILVYFIIFQIRIYGADADTTAFVLISAIFFSCAGMHTANVLYYDGLAPYVAGLSSAYLWVCILCYLCFYLMFFLQTAKKASRAEAYKLQNERLKMRALTEQIKPHFIFNALTTIKSSYHGDLTAGDNALELFSEYIRKSLSLIDNEVIPFEQELKNISHYIDFINACKPRPFCVIYNIDVTDFKVPAFSLQPFVENALNYSKVNEKEDGYIMISTSSEGEFAKISIADNGVGFDVSQLKEGARGINNCKERFRLLFNTEPVISSIVSVSTEITITVRRTAEVS